MSWQTVNSNITIGNFQFSGIHELRIKKSIRTYNDTATITVPSLATYIPKGKKSAVTATTATLFTDGSPVQIDLGYNGNLNSEFTGFVRRRGTGMPLVVECEGYVRQLRLNVGISGNYNRTPTSAAKLLAQATNGTDITVSCPVDYKLSNIAFSNFNGVQIIDMIKEASLGALSIFFSTPKTLYCGLVYLAYAQGNNPFANYQVDYRLGWNCPKQNGLKERIPSEPVQVILKGKDATGNLLYNASKEKNAVHKKNYLTSQMPDSNERGDMAQEIAYSHNYTGYEGNLTGFLSPYAYPGMNVNLVNAEYPDLNGVYLIESTEVIYGVTGAKRIVTVGPKLSFDNPAVAGQ
jgi:hypothetical protein